MSSPLEEKKRKRFAFLNKAYEQADGNTETELDPSLVGLAIDMTDPSGIVQYLENEGLITAVPWLGSSNFTLSHAGVLEVEAALAHPDRPTAHFPPITVNHITYNGTVQNSPVQQGTSHSVQNVTIHAAETDLKAITAWLAELKIKLPSVQLDDDDRAACETAVATMELALKSPKLLTGVLREAGKSVRAILENMTASAVVCGLIQTMPAWFLLHQ